MLTTVACWASLVMLPLHEQPSFLHLILRQAEVSESRPSRLQTPDSPVGLYGPLEQRRRARLGEKRTRADAADGRRSGRRGRREGSSCDGGGGGGRLGARRTLDVLVMTYKERLVRDLAAACALEELGKQGRVHEAVERDAQGSRGRVRAQSACR